MFHPYNGLLHPHHFFCQRKARCHGLESQTWYWSQCKRQRLDLKGKLVLFLPTTTSLYSFLSRCCKRTVDRDSDRIKIWTRSSCTPFSPTLTCPSYWLSRLRHLSCHLSVASVTWGTLTKKSLAKVLLSQSYLQLASKRFNSTIRLVPSTTSGQLLGQTHLTTKMLGPRAVAQRSPRLDKDNNNNRRVVPAIPLPLKRRRKSEHPEAVHFYRTEKWNTRSKSRFEAQPSSINAGKKCV